jgi:flagellin-like hook-associated protein FlgL
MSRIGTYGANQLYLARLNEIQLRLSQRQIQVTTEKKSTNYTGIARDADRLINFENDKARSQQFIDGNAVAQTRLKATEVSLSAIEQTMKDFRDRLDDFYMQETRTRTDVEALQRDAYRAMIDMQSYLASNVDGQYIFSGGRISNEPVAFIAKNLDDFQSIYDGTDHTYPTTRSAHMLELSTTNAQTGNITFDGTSGSFNAASLTSTTNNPLNLPVGSRITVNDSASGANDGKTFTVRSVSVGGGGTTVTVSPLVAELGTTCSLKYFTSASQDEQQITASMDFDPGADTITITGATGFTVGQAFEVSGSTSNDGGYEVESITAGPPDVVTIKSTKVATAAVPSSTITFSASSWYNGDNLAIEHRVATDRQVDLGIYASDPAFEKAFRAMGIIAQGAYGTGGGLENNPDRVVAARYLIRDALESPAGTSPPYGTEEPSDIKGLQNSLGTTQSLINSKDAIHKQFIGFLDTRIVDIENVDTTEAIALLLDDQRALEASYQSLAKVRSLSLLNFLN